MAVHGIDGGEYVIADVAPDRGDRSLVIHAPVGSNEQAEANARLIAAAPKLLEALEEINKVAIRLPFGLREQAVAAIANAKGEAL
ncbi:hypothetical protein [Verrucomicrobium sp. BvORR106]|uniref:hypothetical protein n=1 Tax=Verrucomicrobium sp. BvORR106 TaxID=1403819 RepID=UPI00056DD427|nr:hypothetical protein [Verrucomicrobium sp. BvORR106]